MAGLGVGEALLGEALLADAGMAAAFEGLAPELLLGGAGDIAGLGITSLTPELMGGALAPEVAGTAANAATSAAPEALSNIPSYLSPSGIQSAGIDSLMSPDAQAILAQSREAGSLASNAPGFQVASNTTAAGIKTLPASSGNVDISDLIRNDISYPMTPDGNVDISDLTGIQGAGTPTSPITSTAPAPNASSINPPGPSFTNASSINAVQSPGRLSLLQKLKALPLEDKMLYGTLGSYGLKMLKDDAKRHGVPNQTPYTGPLSKFGYNPALYNPSSSYLPMYRAQGGIMSLDGPDMAVGGQPMLSAPVTRMASGGISDLGSYSDGGRLLKDDQGDGMNDGIPATIAGKRPARLSEGEFVVPADVVSDLGNGSTDAGAKQLYSMMARVRKARHGTESQGRQVNARQLMSA